MNPNPDISPWGEIDWSETLIPGIEMVATPRHGGIMVSREASVTLTPAARKCGSWQGGYLCFEAEHDENIVLRELLDQDLWQIPERIKDRTAFVASIDQNIQTYHPEYWKAREKRLAQPARHPRTHANTPQR